MCQLHKIIQSKWYLKKCPKEINWILQNKIKELMCFVLLNRNLDKPENMTR